MKIEKPKAKDLSKINVIAKQVHDMHLRWRPDLFLQTDMPISKEYFSLLLENNEIMVCKDGTKIVGYMITAIKEKSIPVCVQKKTVVIDNIGVLDECRSKGVGQSFVNHVIEWVKKNNFDDIELTVSPENLNAIKFYEKQGMKVKNIKYQIWVKNGNKPT